MGIFGEEERRGENLRITEAMERDAMKISLLPLPREESEAKGYELRFSLVYTVQRVRLMGKPEPAHLIFKVSRQFLIGLI